jgi:hypothetical protein
MDKKLFLVLITIGLFFSNTLKAETVLYCQSKLAAGFINEGGVWREGSFERKRFTVKFNDDFSVLEGVSFKPMECSIQYNHKPNFISCVHLWGEYKTFMYNKIKKRFLYSAITSGGYVDNETDTENLYAGTCQSF